MNVFHGSEGPCLIPNDHRDVGRIAGALGHERVLGIRVKDTDKLEPGAIIGQPLPAGRSCRILIAMSTLAAQRALDQGDPRLMPPILDPDLGTVGLQLLIERYDDAVSAQLADPA